VSREIKAAILGAGGYVGGELLRLIATHPAYKLHAAVSASQAGNAIGSIFPTLSAAFEGVAFCAPGDWLSRLERGDELALFSAAPHGASAALVAAVLEEASAAGITVHAVDSSADFRYRTAADYEAVYGIEHGAPALLDDFAHGVPEHNEQGTRRHAGHPGCFATAALLAAVPLCIHGLSRPMIYVHGVTGSTGSGREPQAGTHHPERQSNLYAYKPLQHRHTPEIAALIEAAGGGQVQVNFVPHSGPFARGIHITLQAQTAEPLSSAALREVYERYYNHSPFVRVVDGTPRLKDVVASNFCHIGVAAVGDSVVVMSVIDNLVKGAAGGAVQWMNRLWSLPESSGLTASAPAWT
jgi:N-acetyl-gamma-glutamyl-phosphate reductase